MGSSLRYVADRHEVHLLTRGAVDAEEVDLAPVPFRTPPV